MGIDGVTALQYAEGLDEKLGELEDRVKAGRWRAPPVRRAYIPKDGGKKRPLGIPTIEDKVLQRAFVMLLEPVFEADFLDVSYGFRPGRRARDALVRLREGLRQMGGGWVLGSPGPHGPVVPPRVQPEFPHVFYSRRCCVPQAPTPVLLSQVLCSSKLMVRGWG